MLTHQELVARKMARIHDVHRLIPSRTALLINDMQTSFMDPGASLAVSQAWDILPKIKTLINFCREVGVPVIFTEYIYDPAIPCLRGDPFGPEHLPAQPGEPTGWGYPSSNSIVGAPGPEKPDTIAEIAPLPGELVVRGHTLDKFYCTPLDLALRARDIRYLIFAGMMADLCLGATLFSAAMRDFRVTALTDGITTIWPNVLEVMFDIFGRKLARLMTTEAVIQEIKEQLG